MSIKTLLVEMLTNALGFTKFDRKFLHILVWNYPFIQEVKVNCKHKLYRKIFKITGFFQIVKA